MNTTITFRTDKQLKEEASKLFESMGLNLSTALNLFMRQAVIKNRFPMSIDDYLIKENTFIYNSDILDYFGKGKNIGLDEEPDELNYKNEDISL